MEKPITLRLFSVSYSNFAVLCVVFNSYYAVFMLFLTAVTYLCRQIPSWTVNLLTPLPAAEPAESTDDAVFVKRHLKPELEEKRRKRCASAGWPDIAGTRAICGSAGA